MNATLLFFCLDDLTKITRFHPWSFLIVIRRKLIITVLLYDKDLFIPNVAALSSRHGSGSQWVNTRRFDSVDRKGETKSAMRLATVYLGLGICFFPTFLPSKTITLIWRIVTLNRSVFSIHCSQRFRMVSSAAVTLRHGFRIFEENIIIYKFTPTPTDRVLCL